MATDRMALLGERSRAALATMTSGALYELLQRAIDGKFRLSIPPQPGDDDLILAALIDEVFVLRAAADGLGRQWDRLCRCVDEFEPEDMGACDEQRGYVDDAILAVIAARAAPPRRGDAGAGGPGGGGAG